MERMRMALAEAGYSGTTVCTDASGLIWVFGDDVPRRVVDTAAVVCGLVPWEPL